jgi:hypothetical protein
MLCSLTFHHQGTPFMTTFQTSAEPLPLDPATFNTMLGSTIEALPHPPRATAEQRAQQREAALLAIAALHPRDPLEALLAARIVALHFHAMHDLACSIQPNIPGELQLRCQGRAIQLGRQSDMMRADYLNRQQTEQARRPAGLPASAAVPPEPQAQPQPQPQPAPQAAAADPKAAPPTAEAAPKPALAARPAAAAPVARPLKAPVPVPRSGDAIPLDKAALEQLVAEADARPQTSAVALAA